VSHYNLEPEPNENVGSGQVFRRHAERLRALGQSREVLDGNLSGAFPEIVAATANGLECDRVTIWIYNADYTEVRCVSEKMGSVIEDSERILHRGSFRNYFEALDKDRVCAVHDTALFNEGAEFRDGRPPEPKISAFIASPFAVRGQRVGILRADQLKQPRTWLAADEFFIGSLADLLALTIEASERRRAEQALRTSEEKLRMVLEAAREFAFLLLDEHGNIAELSAGGEQVLGYREWELVGKSGSIIFTPEDRAAGVPEREQARALETGRSADERWHMRKDGSTFWASGFMYSLKDDSERLRGYVKVLRDITSRKLAEDRINSLNDDLERRVAERTVELKRTVEQLERFSYTVAHDLRAPLRSMQNFSTILLEDHASALGSEAVDMLKRIKSSSERMDHLIRDLLEYSRLGFMNIASQEVPLATVVETTLKDLADEIRGKNAEIFVGHPLPVVLGHRATLEHVLNNLLTNALKFTRDGQRPEIKIFAEYHEPWVRLVVMDNGIGIADEHRERIFGIFERLHGNETYPGTGVGLAIVRKAIERLGGRSGVDSEPSEGSSFWFELKGRSE
jgi:PAS domain S-box-containing protein